MTLLAMSGSGRRLAVTVKAVRCQARDVLNQYQTETLKLSLRPFDEIEKASDTRIHVGFSLYLAESLTSSTMHGIRS